MFVVHDGQTSDDLTVSDARKLVLRLVDPAAREEAETVMAAAQIDYRLPARDGGTIHVYGVA